MYDREGLARLAAVIEAGPFDIRSDDPSLYCRNGHLKAGDNLIVHNGEFRCRRCKAEATRRWRESTCRSNQTARAA